MLEMLDQPENLINLCCIVSIAMQYNWAPSGPSCTVPLSVFPSSPLFEPVYCLFHINVGMESQQDSVSLVSSLPRLRVTMARLSTSGAIQLQRSRHFKFFLFKNRLVHVTMNTKNYRFESRSQNSF